MSESDSQTSSENSSFSGNKSLNDSSSPPLLESSISPPSQNSNFSTPSPDSTSSPPSQDSSFLPPLADSSSTPPPPKSTSSPPSPESNSSPPPPESSLSSPPPPPPQSSLSSPPPPQSSLSSPPPPQSTLSSPPPSQSSLSSPPPPRSPPSPPSSQSSLSAPPSPPSPESSLSAPPSPKSSTSPPSPNSSHSSPPGDSDSSSSSPSPPLVPPPSPPSSSESDSPSQGKSSGGDSSPPVSSESSSSSSPPKSSDSDDSSSSSSSSIPSPPSQDSSQNADNSPPADDEESPPKPSESQSSHRSTDNSPIMNSNSSSSGGERSTRSTPRLSPPSSGSSKASLDRGGASTGAVVSLVLAGVVITLIAIFVVIARRKKKKMHSLVDHYRPPPSFSSKSDDYYHRNENSVGFPSFSDQRLGTPPYGSQRGQQGYYSGPDPSGSKSCFSYEELMSITNGFSSENIIGEGGFGCVYKGTLPDGKPVAVKQLKAGSGQGEREFRAEVDIISRVHHRHLVSLVGYSVTETQRLLVYEFVPNKTLEHHLHEDGLLVMEWPKRLKIAIGSAKGLAYLHEDCHPRIIHRDIKSANILIDNDWEAQVADFGLAKLSNDTHTHVSTRIMGTFGYLAPEYASSGKLTDRSDVFSFGVVLLELITGRKPVDASQPLGNESLVEWARPLLVRALETGNFDQLVDERLENYTKNEMFRMIEAAAACVRHSAPKRPRMVQVVRALDCEGDMTDLSNGMKFGQSQVYDSGQYSADIQRFRRTALGNDDFSSEYGYSNEYDRRSSPQSGEYRKHSREYHNRSHNSHDSWRSGESSGEHNGESETRAMFRRPGERSVGSFRYGSRAFP